MTAARTGTELGPDSPIPDKLYFKIGEVSQLVGVRAHVLRYWEKEISSIRPSKSASNQRRYRRKDVEIFREIRRLLYEERYTLAGARKRLMNGNKDGAPAEAAASDSSPSNPSTAPTGSAPREGAVAPAEPPSAAPVEPPSAATTQGVELTPGADAPLRRKPQLDLGFARAADTERLERVKAGLRELIRLAEEA